VASNSKDHSVDVVVDPFPESHEGFGVCCVHVVPYAIHSDYS
jgi:hypothetical protein